MPQQQSDADVQTVHLAPLLDHAAAIELADNLRAARGADLDLDGSQVSRLGAQCLQVLVSAARTWSADGHRLSLSNGSDQLFADLQLFGVTKEALETGDERQ